MVLTKPPAYTANPTLGRRFERRGENNRLETGDSAPNVRTHETTDPPWSPVDSVAIVTAIHVLVCVYVCVCVSVGEWERERERGGDI